MSERFFDDLARTLASPMPRRRAIRLAGGALVAAALPGVFPRNALAGCGKDTKCMEDTCHDADAGHIGGCGVEGKTGCGSQVNCRLTGGCLIAGDTCCRAGVGPKEDAWICPKGTECDYKVPSARRCTTCPPARKCGNTCCLPDEVCEHGECVPCPGPRRCGKGGCCDDGAVCRNTKRGLCCDREWKVCQAGRDNAVNCCPPDKSCCINAKTGTAVCCTTDTQECAGSTCACKKGMTPCGKDCCDKSKGQHCSPGPKSGICCPKGEENSKGMCCPKGQENSNGRCCPKGKVNCGDDECCNPKDCCGKTCCGKSTVCTSGDQCCPRPRAVGAGKSGKCCPPGTYATDSGGCCPSSNPYCCDAADGSELECLGGATCVKGGCVKL